MQMRSKPDRFLTALFGFLAVLFGLTCICSTAWLAGKYYLSQQPRTSQPAAVPTQTPMVEIDTVSPSLPAIRQSPTVNTKRNSNPTPTILSNLENTAPKTNLQTLPVTPVTPEQAAQETLKTLGNTDVPFYDMTELAIRLGGRTDLLSLPTPLPHNYRIGDQQLFWTLNVDRDQKYQVPATLTYLNDRVYFWVRDGLDVNQKALIKLADTFSREIYPTDRQFFGSEWTPGIDGDPRLHILLTSDMGSTVAGYFYSADEFPLSVNHFSNEHEMFMINSDTVRLDSPFTYGVLAHEFQHMIHWNNDRNEETWMNEGFANVASFINGYDIGGSDRVYVQNTDIQLTDWPPKPQPDHYGGAFLFLTYFLDRFGENATKALVSNPANGMASIDQVLAGQGDFDPGNHKPVTADDVFIEWAVANYLQDPKVDDGRFSYHNYPAAPQASDTEVIKNCPTDEADRQVHQYGIDYVRIRCSGNYTLSFHGSKQVTILQTNAHSGDYVFWSNYGDESDMTLTRPFDFSTVTGPLSLNYWTWYDIESGYDRVYLLASDDNGKSWNIVNIPSGSTEDQSGYSYGIAYTGTSGPGDNPQWIQESVDLSAFSGKEILLRFEYVTDSAVNHTGFLLDDISIPQIGYSSNFEQDNGGWEAQGFARVQNVLPQTFRLAIINKGRSTGVDFYTLNGNNSIEIPIQIDKNIKEVILVVTGTTRITRQEADYSFRISP